MNYDYKIINVNANAAFVKRTILYVAILLAIIALALIILDILFEKYLLLLIPGGMLLISAGIAAVIGRSASAFSYRFTSTDLSIEGNGRAVVRIPMSDLTIEREGTESDFIDKTIVKCTFFQNRIAMKAGVSEGAETVKSVIVSFDGKHYLLGFDAYAYSLIGGMKDEL